MILVLLPRTSSQASFSLCAIKPYAITTTEAKGRKKT